MPHEAEAEAERNRLCTPSIYKRALLSPSVHRRLYRRALHATRIVAVEELHVAVVGRAVGRCRIVGGAAAEEG